MLTNHDVATGLHSNKGRAGCGQKWLQQRSGRIIHQFLAYRRGARAIPRHSTSRKKNRATFSPRVSTYPFSINEAGVIIAEERHAGLDGYGCISDYLRISISGLAFVHNLDWTPGRLFSSHWRRLQFLFHSNGCVGWPIIRLLQQRFFYTLPSQFPTPTAPVHRLIYQTTAPTTISIVL